MICELLGFLISQVTLRGIIPGICKGAFDYCFLGGGGGGGGGGEGLRADVTYMAGAEKGGKGNSSATQAGGGGALLSLIG